LKKWKLYDKLGNLIFDENMLFGWDTLGLVTLRF
jgi:hypothetical protein